MATGRFSFPIRSTAKFHGDTEGTFREQLGCFSEAQLKTLSVPNTGMVVAIDIGEWNDIHPLNKKEVGRRLTLAAAKVAYGDGNVVSSGPLFESMKINGNRIAISFTNTGSGLSVKGGGELKNFAIAGSDGKFIWAEAKIKNNTVIVRNPKIRHPVAVRYAWLIIRKEQICITKRVCPHLLSEQMNKGYGLIIKSISYNFGTLKLPVHLIIPVDTVSVIANFTLVRSKMHIFAYSYNPAD